MQKDTKKLTADRFDGLYRVSIPEEYHQEIRNARHFVQFSCYQSMRAFLPAPEMIAEKEEAPFLTYEYVFLFSKRVEETGLVEQTRETKQKKLIEFESGDDTSESSYE